MPYHTATCIYHGFVTVWALVAIVASFGLALYDPGNPLSFRLIAPRDVPLAEITELLVGAAIYLFVWWILALIWSIAMCGGYPDKEKDEVKGKWWWAAVFFGLWLIVGFIVLMRAPILPLTNWNGWQGFVYVMAWGAFVLSFIAVAVVILYHYSRRTRLAAAAATAEGEQLIGNAEARRKYR